jgi:RimJ/RimL family protein N-acetyltransferase
MKSKIIIENYSFENFISLSSDDHKDILKLRNQEIVRKWMFDKSKISKDQHNDFIAKLNKDETKLYLMVKRNNKFIGVYSLVNILNSSGQGGFYISDYARKKKLAVEFLFYCFEFIFSHTGINMIYGSEALENKNAFSLNRFFGFYDVIGEQIIYKDENMYRYGELYKNDFKKIRSSPKINDLLEYSAKII